MTELPAVEINRLDRSARDVAGEPAPLVVKSDLVTATALFICAALACLPDRVRQSALCRAIAKKHIALRGSRSELLRTVIPLLDKPISAEELEIGLLADEYEAVAETWRDHMWWRRPITGSLTGGEYLDAALADGHGAVLWICSNGPGRRVALRCLADAGYSQVAVRHYAHPYSPSRLCQAFMNPISNRADDRYLEAVVIAHDDNTKEATETLDAHLDANKLVLVTADETFGERHEITFFGGTLRLGLGAPQLANQQGVPLIPLLCLANKNGGYDLIAEQPLVDGSEKESTPSAARLAEGYAAILERYLKRDPQMWESWLAPDTWSPNKNGGPEGPPS